MTEEQIRQSNAENFTTKNVNAKKFNVIFVLLDGLRSDRVSLCKNLKSIINKSVFFPNMITVVPYTVASVASILSGLHPSSNGVDSYYNMFRFKKDLCKTLAQYLKSENYHTAADVFMDCSIVPQGFDEISYSKDKGDYLELHKNIISKLAEKNKTAENKRFFLYLQYEHIHGSMMNSVGKMSDQMEADYFKNKQKIADTYNSFVLECDEYVKGLVEHVESLGLLNNTIFVFFSDHGLSNGERIGEKMYGVFTYDYTLKTFLSIYAPTQKHKQIDLQIRTIDIMPTLLDMLGINEDDKSVKIQGKSLLPMINGEEETGRPAFSETGGLYGPWPSPKKHNVFSLRDAGWKIIRNPDGYELYDLENDPEEKNNLFGKDKEMSDSFNERLDKMIKLIKNEA